MRRETTRSTRATSASSASGRSRSPTTSADLDAGGGEAQDPGRLAPGSGATPTSCPFDGRPPAERSALEPGLTPLVRADRLAERLGLGEVWIKNDAANPTHSFKDRVVAVALAKATRARLRDRRLRLDRQPRERGRAPTRPPRASTPTSSSPPTSRSRSCSRPASTARRWSACAAPTTTSTGSARELSRGRAVGVRQRQPAPVLRGGLEDARLRDRRAARLEAARPRRRARSPRARCSRSSAAASASGSSSGWSRASCRRSTAPRPRAAARSPSAFADGSDVCRPQQARHDRQEPRDRRSRPTAPTRSIWRAAPAARSSRSPTTRSATGSGCSPRRPGIFTETAGGVTIGDAREARRAAARSARTSGSSSTSRARA